VVFPGTQQRLADSERGEKDVRTDLSEERGGCGIPATQERRSSFLSVRIAMFPAASAPCSRVANQRREILVPFQAERQLPFATRRGCVMRIVCFSASVSLDGQRLRRCVACPRLVASVPPPRLH
jgi:hypothetical protein